MNTTVQNSEENVSYYNSFIGEIGIVGQDWSPEGWLACDGKLLDTNKYKDLFSIIGNKFGGDAEKGNFALPNLNSRIPLGCRDDYTIGSSSDQNSIKLSSEHLASHIHSIDSDNLEDTISNSADLKVYHGEGDESNPAFAKSYTSVIQDATNLFLLLSKNNATTTIKDAVTNISTIPNTTKSTGSSKPFNNMPPYIAINFIICYKGLSPTNSSRNEEKQ